MSAFVDTTRARLSRCRTQPEYYAVQLDIMKFATPRDYRALVDATPEEGWVPQFNEWLARQYDNMMTPGWELSDFALAAGDDAASLYSEGAGRSRLAIGFGGRAELLFLPAATILQYFAADADVLVLRDFSKRGFTRGLAGYGDTFAEMIDGLRDTFELAGYGSVRCLGTSGSGAAALAAGVVLDAERAVSFCGFLPSGGSRGGEEGEMTLEVEDLLRRSEGSTERFIAVYGEEERRDARNAKRLAEAFAVALHPVPDVDDHNIIRRLHAQGRLMGVLRDVGLVG